MKKCKVKNSDVKAISDCYNCVFIIFKCGYKEKIDSYPQLVHIINKHGKKCKGVD